MRSSMQEETSENFFSSRIRCTGRCHREHLSRSAARSDNPKIRSVIGRPVICVGMSQIIGSGRPYLNVIQPRLGCRHARTSPTTSNSHADGSGTSALTAEAIGIDWRQFSARTFKSAGSTVPSVVKSPTDHCVTLCWGQKYVGNLALILDRCDAERPVRSDSHNRHGFSTHSDQYRNTYGSSTPHDP